MPAMNLKRLDVDALLSLRADIDKKLQQKRGELERQLSRLGPGNAAGGRGGFRSARGRRGSALKGRRVPPKYRSPSGETWAGRGARPRWLAALIKQGHKIEEYAINRLAAARKATVAKRSRRKRR